MAPPKQVEAPPKGSISVGWLWVSFLNIRSHFSVMPSTSTSTYTEQAFISSDTSRSSNFPDFLSSLPEMVAISIREICFLSIFSPWTNSLLSRYWSKVS